MSEAVARCLRDGRLDGEHAPALAVGSTLRCSPLAARAMLHLAAAVASHAAAGKAQARGLVIVAFDRSPEVYLDFMRRRGLDQNALNRCVHILDCYSDPIGWKEKIRSQQQHESSVDLCATNKANVIVFRNVKDVDKLLCSSIDLGRGFEGTGKICFSIAVDSISSMLRHASVSSISSFLSNLRSHDQISSIFWLIHSDLHEPKFSRAFECLTTMVASLEPAVVDSVHEEEIPGDVSFLEENYSKAKFYVRLKRRNGRVKHLYEELHVEGNEVRFVSMPSVSTEVNQSLLPKVQFNLELSEKERSDRANVVLPFEHQGKGEPIRIYDGRRSLPEDQRDPNLTASALLDEVPKSATPKGEIHYIRDSDDEQPDSDEDPDDDLDI
ncbi:elongator complex protein 5-like [Oryza brachyantha]|uniref:Elongator complex protein 5 n=1 Tax=Oryza brachyantha TaxID=4533 RepID=J3LWM3_ORYBR|nr:elongator complex protein 5-like [Oryza brachyantha]